jgi:hypothetical protein
MKRIASLRTRGAHEPRCYRHHVLKNPLQALVVVTAVGVAVLTLSILIPLVLLLGAEVVMIAALPKCEWFRRSVDRELALVERARAVDLRASLLARMSDEHRRELDSLERLAARVREQSGGAGEGDDSPAVDWLGLDRLLATYVQLATACRSSTESCRAIERCALDSQISTLESMSISATAATRTWIDRRLGIVRRRLATAQRLRDDSESLAHGLAMIADLVRWTHDECIASRAELLRDQLEDALATCERNGPTLRELSALCSELEPVDARLLALGRAPVAVVHEVDPRSITQRVIPISAETTARALQHQYTELSYAREASATR